MNDLSATLAVECKTFNTADTCVKGSRSVHCEWLNEMFGCAARETPKEAAKKESDCGTKMTGAACNRAGYCMFDTSSGQCHEESEICAKVKCGEERSPPTPLQCMAPLQKVRADGACCFTCQ